MFTQVCGNSEYYFLSGLTLLRKEVMTDCKKMHQNSIQHIYGITYIYTYMDQNSAGVIM